MSWSSCDQFECVVEAHHAHVVEEHSQPTLEQLRRDDDDAIAKRFAHTCSTRTPRYASHATKRLADLFFGAPHQPHRAADVASCLQGGADPDYASRDHDGAPVTMAAAVRHDDASLRLLLDAGANADAVDLEGYTPLIAAASCGADECVRLLLRARADANFTPGPSALRRAVDNGHAECAAALLDAGARLDDAYFIEPILFSASRYSTCGFGTRCLQLLLDAGASVNDATDDGSTAFSVVVESSLAGDVGVLANIFGVLLAYGAGRESPLRVGRCTTLDAAAVGQLSERSRVVSESTLVRGCQGRLDQSMRLLSDEAVDFVRAIADLSPLHLLAFMTPQRARQLLRQGADIHLRRRLQPGVYWTTDLGFCDIGAPRAPLPGAVTPLEMAQMMHRLAAPASNGLHAFDVVLQAHSSWDEPWSPATDATWSDPARLRSRELLRMGWRLSRCVDTLSGFEQAFVDLWIVRIMPLVMQRSGFVLETSELRDGYLHPLFEEPLPRGAPCSLVAPTNSIYRHLLGVDSR